MFKQKINCLYLRNLSNIRFHFSTVNDSEVEHFSRLHNNWWDKQGEMKPLHSMNSVRIKLITGGLVNTGKIKEENLNTPKPLTSIKILDVGCGGGILSEALVRLGGEVTGLDASEELIATAKAHAALDSSLNNDFSYISTTIEEHSCDNTEVYDAVVASEILEHVADKKIFLKSCISTLKPGGSIFITTLNKTCTSYVTGVILAEYVLKLLSQGTHDWDNFISPEELEGILESYGCTTLLLHGLFYNVLNNRWSWSRSTGVNYALHAVKR